MNYKVILIFGITLIGFSLNANTAPTDVKNVGFGKGNQKWGFVDVREGAHIFWWLYYATPTATKPTDRPLAIWLQGGPGASSTGYGNFAEIGPLDVNLNERNFTWIKDMNVLFIDSPVGSGYSYVDDLRYLATDNFQVATDLVELLRGFYNENPEFKSVPLHIFSESYGGKVSVEFAYLLNKAIQDRHIDCNLKSVTSIDGWVSPIDSMIAWAPFLLQMGFVDRDGHDAIQQSTFETKDALERSEFAQATNLWRRTENIILQKTNGIDFYNVLRPQISQRYNSNSKSNKQGAYNNHKSRGKWTKGEDFKDRMFRTLVKYDQDENKVDALDNLMLGQVASALKIPSNVKWGSQSRATFGTLGEDFMKPVISIVEKLLNETSVEVNIITGQLDLIVATPGTIEWVNKVKWPGATAYAESKRNVIGVNAVLEGYYKKHNKFGVYWINRAGHMVPADNPSAMDWILQRVTKYKEY